MSLETIKALGDRIMGVLPPVLQDSKAEMAYQVNRLLREALLEMGLVTREEFEVQAELLARTRIKLEQLEKMVDDLKRN